MKRVSTRKLRRAKSAQIAARPRRLRPLAVSLARYTSMVAVAGALFASTRSSQAASFSWDQTGGGALGGSGIWNNTNTNWFDGGADVMWPGTGNDAVFAGPSPYTVSVDSTSSGAVIVNNISFTSPGIILQGNTAGDALTLNNSTISTSLASSTVDSTLNVVLTGTTGLIKTGSGALALGGANTFTGGVTISGGILRLNNASALNSNAVVDNGTLDLNFNNVSIGDLSGSGTITDNDAVAGASVLTVNQATNQTFSGTFATGVGARTLGLIKTGSGTLTLTGANAGLQGGFATAGGVTLSNGILRAQTSATALGTATVVINGAGTTLQLASDSSTSFNNATVVSANTQITVDRVTSAATAVTHTLGTLLLGNNTLTVQGGNNLTSGVLGLTFGATTLNGIGTAAASRVRVA